MKRHILFLFFLAISVIVNAENRYFIKPKGYNESSNASFSGNQMSSINKIGGYFRLKEFSSLEDKLIETDMVTYFISKGNESKVNIHINCAKPITLNYEFKDTKNRHQIKISETVEYYRLEKEVDLSRFKDGICTILIFNNRHELIHTIEFEKSTIH